MHYIWKASSRVWTAVERNWRFLRSPSFLQLKKKNNPKVWHAGAPAEPGPHAQELMLAVRDWVNDALTSDLLFPDFSLMSGHLRDLNIFLLQISSVKVQTLQLTSLSR